MSDQTLRSHLCQLNVATMKTSLEHPSMADFVSNLDRINTLAEQHSGFVWRYQEENGNTTSNKLFGDQVVANMSVWTDIDSLVDFVYKSAHRDIFRRKAEWFEKMEVYQVLWWLPKGELPTLSDGKRRFELLAQIGPSRDAFGFREALRETKSQKSASEGIGTLVSAPTRSSKDESQLPN